MCRTSIGPSHRRRGEYAIRIALGRVPRNHPPVRLEGLLLGMTGASGSSILCSYHSHSVARSP